MGKKKRIKSTPAPRKSPLHRQGRRGLPCRCGDAWWGLRWQIELELVHQHLLFGVQFRIAGQDQRTAVCGREVDVEHLDGGEFVEHGPRREAGGQLLEPGAQRDVETIGEEGDEDVRFDAVLKLVIDRAELQIVLEILECGLDLDELDVELPQLGGILVTQIGAQEIAPFAAARLSQLVAVEREAESSGLGRYFDIDQTPCRSGL